MTTNHSQLNPQDRERLTKLIAMSTSPHDGEALAATRKANALLANAKLTWADILQPENQRAAPPADHRAICRFILSTGLPMNDAEHTFVLNILRFDRLRPKQLKWLRSLHERAKDWSARHG
jgi:hypothetical protein